MEPSMHEAEVLAEVRRELGRTLFKEAGNYRERLLRDGSAPFRCRAGSRYLYVDEHGFVHWCSQTRGLFGVPLDQYDVEQLERQFDTRKDCSAKCTVGCARTNSAGDEWRPQRQLQARRPVRCG